MRLTIPLLLCFLLSYTIVTAQSKKAGKLYTKAMYLDKKKRTAKAYKKLNKSIKKAPSSPSGYSQMGRWYYERHMFAQSADVFRQASARCPNGASRFAKPYARSLTRAGRPDQAIQIINAHGTIKDSAEWNKLRAEALFVKHALASPVGPQPANLGIRINTDDAELFPSMAADTQFLFYTRRLNKMDDDLYSARADSCGGWFKGLNMGYLPNTPDYEQAQFISSDGHYLFFTRCDNRSDNGWAEGGCDLFMAYRVANDSPWTVAHPFGETINTPAYEGMPSLSPDNRQLYFVSNRDGGIGGYDIWVSYFEDGVWQEPMNAGPSINTREDETAPYINFDNETLYFTSNGWPGMGGSDLFVCHKTSDSSWGAATNMGYPINTACDEKSACVTLDGKELYFCSDRNGPVGNYDMYTTPITSGVYRPRPVSYIAGYIYDSLTKEKLNYAAIFICDAARGDTLYRLYSNRGDASYLITLHDDHKYLMHVARIGYMPIIDTIIFDKQYWKKPMTHNVSMLPSNYNDIKPINDSSLVVIHYDVNRVELSASEKAMIHKAIAPWLSQAGFVITVNAYTDNTGTPMINEELSQKRAKLVAKYIASQGVNEHMIDAHGWGEAKMIATNETEDGQRQNRRVEIMLKR